MAIMIHIAYAVYHLVLALYLYIKVW